MIHWVKKILPTLLVMYEIMAYSNAAESIKADVPRVTLNSQVTTISSTSQMVYKPPETTTHMNYYKIALGATNITNTIHPNRTTPNFTSPIGHDGPFFDGVEVTNVTARVGSTINLDCRIALLGDKTVSWLQKRDQTINLLTVGKSTHSKDERIQLIYNYQNNFRLRISFVTKRDDGVYECQVATHPPKIRRVFLKITAPEVKIVDESRKVVHDRYYREGSSLLLTCLATSIGFSQIEEPDNDIISWKHGYVLLDSDNRPNVTKETDSAVSTLTIAPLRKIHGGNYTCSVGNLAQTTVAVHVLNGELPAAVQSDGRYSKSRNYNLVLLLMILWSLSR